MTVLATTHPTLLDVAKRLDPNGKIDTDTAVGDPSYETFERDQYTLGYELNHRLNDNWDFQQNLRYGHMELELRQLFYYGNLTDRVINRGLTYNDGKADNLSVDNRLLGESPPMKVMRNQIAKLNEQLMHGTETVDVKNAKGYLVCAPKRKPAKLMKADSAVEMAKAAAKSTGRSELFALVPVGLATRKKMNVIVFQELAA